MPSVEGCDLTVTVPNRNTVLPKEVLKKFRTSLVLPGMTQVHSIHGWVTLH